MLTVAFELQQYFKAVLCDFKRAETRQLPPTTFACPPAASQYLVGEVERVLELLRDAVVVDGEADRVDDDAEHDEVVEAVVGDHLWKREKVITRMRERRKCAPISQLAAAAAVLMH